MKHLKQFEEKPTKLFGKLFWNMLFCIAPFVLFGSFFVLFGAVPFTFNDKQYYGILGFSMTLVLIPWIALCFAIVFWIYYSVGNYFLRLFNRIF
ncbi:hypothetical protein [Ekhidna sp.]